MDNRNPYLQDLSNVHNYDLMKDYLFYRLTSIHDRMINSVPHTVVGDIAITYHILFENSDDTLKSVRVTNSLFDQYGITLDQLHADAMESCPKLFPSVIKPLESVVDNSPVERDPSSRPQMFYISNDIGCNGAAAVFYPDRLNDFANRIGSDLYVIPSSQDECILVPTSSDVDADYLKKTLYECNRMIFTEGKQVSDTLYHYEKDSRKFEKFDEYQKRIHKNKTVNMSL